ncbi:MAG: DUF3473 domain-containing protein [Candidatus Hodarchaeota archaeon]
MNCRNVLTIDVEDWFHILEDPSVPGIEQWASLPLRAPRSISQILQVLTDSGSKATFFWLGWMAERFPELVRLCHQSGHEIASHGYGHLLPYRVGRDLFREDIKKAKDILEYIVGEPIRGFRAPGFGITEETLWAFEVIKEVGYDYDSSIFPASRGHGGIAGSLAGPHIVRTEHGLLPEIPMSVIDIFGKKLSMFGGGYLRLATRQMIRFGISVLRRKGQPLVVYIHPREVDPCHPRLSLSWFRKFKSYVNLRTTMPKLQWLCEAYSFCTMFELVERYMTQFYSNGSDDIPVVELPPRAIELD